MANKIYVNGINSISPQPLFDNGFFGKDFSNEKNVFLQIIAPDYKKFIPAIALRRMAKFMRMGLVSAQKAIQDSKIDKIDAIIVGSGHGNVGDTQKFLTAILDNKETMLVPTSFVQSTHNIVAGSIALANETKSYNMTYTNHSSAFEMSLLDAIMLFEEEEISSALVGGIDEITSENYQKRSNTNLWNKNQVNSLEIFSHSKHNGAILGESAAFFVLSNHHSENSYAELIDVKLEYMGIENIASHIQHFIIENGVSVDEIDMVIGGFNGVSDFDKPQLKIIENLFPEANIAAYKQFVGEHPTSSAFGFWLASQILKLNVIPDEVFYKKKNDNNIVKTILIFHQAYLSDKEFAMVLLRKL